MPRALYIFYAHEYCLVHLKCMMWSQGSFTVLFYQEGSCAPTIIGWSVMHVSIYTSTIPAGRLYQNGIPWQLIRWSLCHWCYPVCKETSGCVQRGMCFGIDKVALFLPNKKPPLCLIKIRMFDERSSSQKPPHWGSMCMLILHNDIALCRSRAGTYAQDRAIACYLFH